MIKLKNIKMKPKLISLFLIVELLTRVKTADLPESSGFLRNRGSPGMMS